MQTKPNNPISKTPKTHNPPTQEKNIKLFLKKRKKNQTFNKPII